MIGKFGVWLCDVDKRCQEEGVEDFFRGPLNMFIQGIFIGRLCAVVSVFDVLVACRVGKPK